MGKTVNYGEYAFLGGLIVAVIIGALSGMVPVGMMPLLIAVLFVFGVVVGLLNISEKEVNTFLIAAVALLLAATSWNVSLAQALGLLGTAGTMVAVVIQGITGALIAFISPAAFIVAIKAVYKLASPD